jgi:aromatic ring-opening dioxygenase LigB subunit
VDVKADMDLALVDTWGSRAAAQGVPVTTLVMRDPALPFPLDWGALIPLALLAPEPETPPVAIACPSTAIKRSQLIAWGNALVDASNALERRVAFIVSADQGHGHAADGPYGYDPASAAYDAAMVKAIADNDLARLLTWKNDWLEEAKMDSYWQTLALLGVQRSVPLQPRILSYEIDHYFGLLCAVFQP